MIFELKAAGEAILQPYFSLSDRELRARNLFMAESPNVIERALDVGIRPVSLLAERKNMDWIAAHILPRYPDIPVIVGSLEELSVIKGFPLIRGLLCLMQRPEEKSVLEILEHAGRICVLYDLCDATNVGAIFRTAAALGYDAVVLSRRACDPLARRSLRTSMGTVFQVTWCKADDILPELRNAGFISICTALKHDSISLENFKMAADTRYAVIFGEEGPGLPDDVIACSDYAVAIPMKSGVDSLNVGAAAAILLWHFRHNLTP